MKVSIIFAIFAILVTLNFSYGVPVKTTENKSSITINNGVVLSGLELKSDHPAYPFTNFERDAKCYGSCTCYGSNCFCSCYSCLFDSQCIAGCLSICWNVNFYQKTEYKDLITLK